MRKDMAALMLTRFRWVNSVVGEVFWWRAFEVYSGIERDGRDTAGWYGLLGQITRTESKHAIGSVMVEEKDMRKLASGYRSEVSTVSTQIGRVSIALYTVRKSIHLSFYAFDHSEKSFSMSVQSMMSMICHCHFLARPDKELNSYINFVENTLVNIIKKVTQFMSEEKQD